MNYTKEQKTLAIYGVSYSQLIDGKTKRTAVFPMTEKEACQLYRDLEKDPSTELASIHIWSEKNGEYENSYKPKYKKMVIGLEKCEYLQ